MALASASGPAAIAEQYLANMLANSSTYQALTGSADEVEAATTIFFGARTEPAADEYSTAEDAAGLPFALISTLSFRMPRVTSGPGANCTAAGTLRIDVIWYDDTTKTMQENYRDNMNTIGGICTDISDQSADPGTLEIIDITITPQPELDSEEEMTELGDQDDTDPEIWAGRNHWVIEVEWSRGTN